MSNISKNIAVVAHDYTGRLFDLFIPVFDCYPKDMNYVCSSQNFKIHTDSDKVIITLACYDKDDNRIEEDIDISCVCKNQSLVKLCVVKSERTCELFVYRDSLHNCKFELSPNFY